MDPVNEQTIDPMVEAIVQVIHPDKIIGSSGKCVLFFRSPVRISSK